ncbi:DUF1010 domain-containing protein (plasmid) [Klebsiella pneumoniae]|uniref:DUF1010 domain-containing protein n=1 Tax=Klebsiella pneumoniae TaxID=573 RepID=UPI003F6B2816
MPLFGLRLHGLRRFSVFLASSPCVASASSYRFCSAVPPRWRSVFSRLAPVAKFKLSVLASGSNISVQADAAFCGAAYLSPLDIMREAVTIEISNSTIRGS